MLNDAITLDNSKKLKAREVFTLTKNACDARSKVELEINEMFGVLTSAIREDNSEGLKAEEVSALIEDVFVQEDLSIRASILALMFNAL